MIQMNMFDMKGKPTELGMRYVKPKYYTVDVYTKDGHRRLGTDDVHEAIGFWLKNIDAKIVTHW
jgi:hypothetical protein